MHGLAWPGRAQGKATRPPTWRTTLEPYSAINHPPVPELLMAEGELSFAKLAAPPSPAQPATRVPKAAATVPLA